MHSTAEQAHILPEHAAAGQQQLPGGEHARTQRASLPQHRRASEAVLECLQQVQSTGGEADLRIAEQK